MAVVKGIQVDGIEDLLEAIEVMHDRKAFNLLRATIQGVAVKVAKEVRRRAPKDEGTLRKNIKAKRRKPRGGKPYSDVVIGGDAFYWRFVEYGTQLHPQEQPFVRPTVDGIRADIPVIIREEFIKKLTAAAKRAGKKRR